MMLRPRRSSRFSTLVAGQRVEARFGGNNTKVPKYPGAIVKANKDGSYHILYDDGEEEMNVRRRYIDIDESPAPATPTATPIPPDALCKSRVTPPMQRLRFGVQ